MVHLTSILSRLYEEKKKYVFCLLPLLPLLSRPFSSFPAPGASAVLSLHGQLIGGEKVRYVVYVTEREMGEILRLADTHRALWLAFSSCI